MTDDTNDYSEEDLESIVMKFYGDEKIDAEFKQLIEELTGREFNDYLTYLKKLNPEKTVEEFITIAVKTDYRWSGKNKDYYKNLVALMWELAQKPGFYESLCTQRNQFESLNSAKRAAFLIYGQ